MYLSCPETFGHGLPFVLQLGQPISKIGWSSHNTDKKLVGHLRKMHKLFFASRAASRCVQLCIALLFSLGSYRLWGNYRFLKRLCQKKLGRDSRFFVRVKVHKEIISLLFSWSQPYLVKIWFWVEDAGKLSSKSLQTNFRRLNYLLFSEDHLQKKQPVISNNLGQLSLLKGLKKYL